MDTISIKSTIQTATNNFQAEDETDYSAITYFSDSKSVLKLEGPSATIYNNTSFASPDFNYPSTLEKDITIPLVGGAIPQGSYILTTTTRVTKALSALTASLSPNQITMPLSLLDNFTVGQTLTWTGGANAGTYTIASISSGAATVLVLTQSLVDTTVTGTITFDEEIITIGTFTYCYTAPTPSLILTAECATANLEVDEDTDYSITCEGQSIQPTTNTHLYTLISPNNSGGSPVYATTTSTTAPFSTTELWTQTWVASVVSTLLYELPSGLFIETSVTGSKSIDVNCDDSLCCMSSCLTAATNRFLAATPAAGGNLNTMINALVTYNKVLGAFMMYSLGVKCGDTTVIDTAVANMKTYLADENCCNNCSDTGVSTQIVALYNIIVSGDNLVLVEGDVYINIGQVTVGSTTTATFTLDTTQVGNLIATYIAANPTVVTNLVNAMKLGISVGAVSTSFDTGIQFTADCASGSPILTNISFTGGALADLAQGDPINATNFPLNTHIQTIGVGTITLSQNATGTALTDSYNIVSTAEGMAFKKYKRVVGAITSYFWEGTTQYEESITIDGTTKSLQLVGDSASPGAIRFYGTDYLGAKGWQFIKSSLVEPTDGISCPAGSSTDTTLFTTTAGTVGTYMIDVTGQFATTVAPTSVVIQIIKNGTIINVNAENQYNAALSATEYYLYAITTLEALVDADVVKLRVTPVGQAITLGNVSARFVRIA